MCTLYIISWPHSQPVARAQTPPNSERDFYPPLTRWINRAAAAANPSAATASSLNQRKLDKLPAIQYCFYMYKRIHSRIILSPQCVSIGRKSRNHTHATYRRPVAAGPKSYVYPRQTPSLRGSTRKPSTACDKILFTRVKKNGWGWNYTNILELRLGTKTGKFK